MNWPDKPLVHILLLVVCALALTVPVLFYGIPELSNDGVEHGHRDHHFAEQFWGGELYPRWLSNMSSGYGSPALFYYPPMASYATALFWPVLHDRDSRGALMEGWGCVLATILAGIMAYWWLLALVDAKAALVGALFYMIAPYHVAIDLYNRGDSGEYWLFVWMPVVMLSAHGLVHKWRYSVAGLILSYGFCVFAHPTVAACFSAVPVVYVLMFSEASVRIRTTLLACCAILLGIGLSGTFLLPAFVDQYKSWAKMYTGGSADYHYWWLFNLRDQITEQGSAAAQIPWYLSFKMRILVITFWTVFLSAMAYWVVRRFDLARQYRRMAAFYLGVVLACLFMMERQSDFIWHIVPLFKYLQSPSRLLMIATLGASALGALAFRYLSSSGARLTAIFFAMTALGWLGADAVSARQAYSRWRHIPAERAAHDKLSHEYEEEYASLWPVTAPAMDLYPVEKFVPFVAAHPPRKAYVDTPSGSVSVENWRPREILLKLNLPEQARLTLNHFYFEGWQATQIGSNNRIAVTPSNPDGFIQANLPPGNYELSIELPMDQAERLGMYMTMVSAVILLAATVWNPLGSSEARRAAA